MPTQLPSGLIVPDSVLWRPAVDTEGFFHTLEDLIGRKVDVADLTHALAKLKRSEVLKLVAGLSEVISRNDGMTLPLQRRLAHELLEPEIWRQLDEGLKAKHDPAGRLFHRRQLWFVLQMALLTCKEDTPLLSDEEMKQAVGLICLMANDVLKHVESVTAIAPEDSKNPYHWLATLLIAFVDVYAGQELICRSSVFWRDALSDPAILTLATAGIGDCKAKFKDKHGVSFDDFFFVLVLGYCHFLEAATRPEPTPLLLDIHQLESTYPIELLRQCFGLISRTPELLAAHLLGMPRQSWATDYGPLRRTPLLELFPDKYTCPDLALFRKFFTDGILLMFQEACGMPFRQLFGEIFGFYVNRLMEAFGVPSTLLARTYFQKPKFEDKTEAGDGLLVWARTAVLAEYKGGVLTARQRYAMQEAETIKGVHDMLGKVGLGKKGVGQLVDNLQKIVAGKAVHYQGQTIDLASCDSIIPMLVVYDDVLCNHAVREDLNSMLIAELDKRGVDRSRIKHLALFSVRDVEVFESLAHAFGAEKVMREYITAIDQCPNDRNGIFHIFALNKYKGHDFTKGWVNEELDRILRGAVADLKRRKDAMQTAAAPTDNDNTV